MNTRDQEKEAMEKEREQEKEARLKEREEDMANISHMIKVGVREEVETAIKTSLRVHCLEELLVVVVEELLPKELVEEMKQLNPVMEIEKYFTFVAELGGLWDLNLLNLE